VPPNETLPAVFPDFAVMAPFAMTHHAQFRPAAPPLLGSREYAEAVNEVKGIGALHSLARTPEQTTLAGLWHAVDFVDENSSARLLVPPDANLVDNARLFALANIAVADAFIAGMDCKYTYNLWRPYHAIRLADTDDNQETDPDPTWEPLIATPRHQEYLSSHTALTAAFLRVLSNLWDDDHPITIASPGFPSASKTYPSFSAAANEVGEARIWAGLHFRFSMETGLHVGQQLADHLTANFLTPRNDR
jgi:hypothetical protein